MATRRVRRIKRTKKQVHRAHGRKTNRHHKRDNRTNKRHSGGMKSFAKMFTDKLNPRGGRLYGGIEVFKGVAADGVARYYIGNRPIAEYEASPTLADRQYGKLIRSKLTDIQHNVDAGSTFTGITFMDKANFDKFEKNFSPPASSASDASDPIINFQILLTPQGIQFADQVFPWQNRMVPLEIPNEMIQRIPFKDKILKASIDKIVFFKLNSETVAGPREGTTFVSIYFLKTNRQAMCALKTYKQKVDIPGYSIALLSDYSAPETPANQINVATLLLLDTTNFTNQLNSFFRSWYEFYNGQCNPSSTASLASQVDALSLSD